MPKGEVQSFRRPDVHGDAVTLVAENSEAAEAWDIVVEDQTHAKLLTEQSPRSTRDKMRQGDGESGNQSSSAGIRKIVLPNEQAESRKLRLEQVARLTERLNSLEESLSRETDERKREAYESEKAMLMETLRQIQL